MNAYIPPPCASERERQALIALNHPDGEDYDCYRQDLLDCGYEEHEVVSQYGPLLADKWLRSMQ
jgi:hypothetical protein